MNKEVRFPSPPSSCSVLGVSFFLPHNVLSPTLDSAGGHGTDSQQRRAPGVGSTEPAGLRGQGLALFITFSHRSMASALTRLPLSISSQACLSDTRPRAHKQTSSSVKFLCHLAHLRALRSRERVHLSVHTDPLPEMLSPSANLCFCPRHSNHPHSQTSSLSNSRVIYLNPPLGDSHNTLPRATCHPHAPPGQAAPKSPHPFSSLV